VIQNNGKSILFEDVMKERDLLLTENANLRQEIMVLKDLVQQLEYENG
jgi:hypothetical protein